MSASDDLLRNNERYAAGFGHGQLSAPPARSVAVVTCMDARIDPAALLGLAPGDAHVLRNAGGVLTQDVLRSLAISQSVLGTREVMFIQHTGCGMLGAEDEEIAAAIREKTGAAPDFPLLAFEDLEQSVRAAIAELRAAPILAHRDAVRGFVYEVETGQLREVV